MNYALPITHEAIALSDASRSLKSENARPWHGVPYTVLSGKETKEREAFVSTRSRDMWLSSCHAKPHAAVAHFCRRRVEVCGKQAGRYVCALRAVPWLC